MAGSVGRRRIWQVGAVLATVVIALAVFAWPQGDDGEGGGPLNAIAVAAERTQEQPGGRAVIRSLVTSPGETIRMTGRMAYDGEREAGFVEFPNPENGEIVRMDLVMEGTMMYMRSDSFESVPDDASWIGLDLALGSEFELPGPAADPKGELELLAAATGGVEKLGKEKVRGVPTTRYSGTIGVAEQAESLREQGGDSLAELTEEEGTPFDVEVWIDAKGLVRSIRIVKSMPAEGDEGPVKTDMKMDFFDFGATPVIELPDSDEVFDATSMAEEELDG